MFSEMELAHQHLWLQMTGAQVFESPCGTAFNFAGQTTAGAYNPSWSTSIEDIMMAAAIQQSTCGFPSIRSCQDQQFVKPRNSLNRLVPSMAAYSTTSSDQSVGVQTSTEARATITNQILHTSGAERAENNDADEVVDSEAEFDGSRYLSDDSELEDDYDPQEEDDDEASENELRKAEELEYCQWNDGEGIEGESVLVDNDASMANVDTISSPVYAQQRTLPAVTNQKKKPRRCKTPRKRVSSHLPREVSVSTLDMDIDMDAVLEQGPGDYLNDSSEDEDTENYVYSSWFKDIYHPMWLGHASTNGKKRRDKTDEDGGVSGASQSQENPPDSVIETEVAKRQIKKPSSRRKRAWNESWGTRSSVAESDCSLVVNQPMPPPTSNTGAMSSPAMASAPIAAISPVQMHTAPRTTQPRNRQNPARALEHRLEKLRVGDKSRRNSTTTTVSTTTNSINTTNTTANDSRPRLSMDRQEKKRPRYSHPASFDVTSMDITEGEDGINIPLFWDIVEEPMDFRSSGMDEQLDASGFEMMGVEGAMTSTIPGIIPLGDFDRVKDISRVLGNVDELL